MPERGAALLAELGGHLRRLLDALQDREAPAERVRAAWLPCAASEARWRLWAERESTPEQRAAVAGELEYVLRLHAVAVGLIDSERAELTDRLDRAQKARRFLAETRPAGRGLDRSG